MQVGPSRTLEAVFAIVMEKFQNQRRPCFAYFQIPPWGQCLSRLWAAGQGRERGIDHTLPSISKPKFCHTTSPALLLVFFFPMDSYAIWEAGFSIWEPLFGIRGKVQFFRKPYLVCFPSLSLLNLCKGLWPPSSPVMPEHYHPALWPGL